MRLNNITATPHPLGNRIDLKWENPEPDMGVLVVRRESTHPVHWVDGVKAAEGDGLDSASDEHLKGETVYYYTLFPYTTGEPRQYIFDPRNRAVAMPTSPYDAAGRMYDLLPGIYHRYDIRTPPDPSGEMSKEEMKRGQLRRFLDLPGSQLDQLRSFADAMLHLHDIDKVDGRLLPLLGQWIGWPTDYRQEISAQREEIRNAPHVYKTIGLIPTMEAAVKRLTGWESRTREFVHNVFLTNRPERLNLWTRRLSVGGEWSAPGEPLSLDFAYEGRPASVRDEQGMIRLYYHTLKSGRWSIWCKTYDPAGGWEPSQPFADSGLIDKHPAAVNQDGAIRVFWSAFDQTNRTWRIFHRVRNDGVWSSIDVFGDEGTERKAPAAAVDHAGAIWLFWLERTFPGGRGRLFDAGHGRPDPDPSQPEPHR